MALTSISISASFWDERKIAYCPLSPELKASSVLAWKRQQPFSLATTKFIEHIKNELEQLLVMFVGMADTLVVSYAGEAAVSGVSLVNQFNTIFIYLFTALASGGAVVISQYIGRNEKDCAGKSASQILLFSAMFSMLSAIFVLIGNDKMLRLMFGRVEDSVMQACITYLRISAYSYPALAVYNAGAAVYRSKWIFLWDGDLMKRILNIALSSIVALFGTYQIAANGVAQSIWSMAALAGVSMGVYYSNRAVYGEQKYRSGGILF